MVPLLIDRRCFLRAAGAVYLTGLSAGGAEALTRSDAVFASAFRRGDGGYGAALVSEEGTVVAAIDLPDRAHGLARSAEWVVAFARRPGTFAFAFSRDGHSGPITINAEPDRHFFGHGQFSPDGRLLYASENDFDGGRGMIGLYDVARDFRRIGEFPAHGIGTHDLQVSEDGRHLVIANGGIETHPDFGRTKLNLDGMQPSLVLADARTGTLIEKHDLPAGLSRLSTRHLDLGRSGRLWFACQYEGSRRDHPPLIGHFALGEDLTFIDLPPPITEGLANYVGAIAVNRAEDLVGVTSPVGGLTVMLDAATGRVLAATPLEEAAGIAPARSGFAVSSYDGRFRQTDSPVHWDQHIIRL